MRQTMTSDPKICTFFWAPSITNVLVYYFNARLFNLFQLHNTIKDVNLGVLQQLHEDLVELRRCQGPKECSKRSQFSKFRYLYDNMDVQYIHVEDLT